MKLVTMCKSFKKGLETKLGLTLELAKSRAKSKTTTRGFHLSLSIFPLQTATSMNAKEEVTPVASTPAMSSLPRD